MTALHLPDLPLTEAAWIFAVLVAVVLLVPLVAERARIPTIVGLILAGMAIGPEASGLLERDGAIETLGSVGLLYLMFVAGLELDLDDFAKYRRNALVFGGLTFIVPMAIGTAAIFAAGFDLLAATLLASCWASHTLLTYPTFRRFGTFGNRAVATSVGATILTDTAALLVLVVVARAYEGDLGVGFWATLIPSLGALLVLTLYLLPRLAAWFFTGIGQDRNARFTFLLLALFACSALAELAGIEAIIGAFLAGLALNRLVPNESVTMERIEFLGSTLLIPLFLISVGMLINPRLLIDPSTIEVAGIFTAVALGTKLLAAAAAGGLFRYTRFEIAAMFSLSGAQAAATLAAVIVGLQVGLIDTDTVNAVVMVILITCLVSSWAANRAAPRLERPGRPQALGGMVVVPVARPGSRSPLVMLAAAIAKRDSGFVIPLTVVGAEVDESTLSEVREATMQAEGLAMAHGAEASGLVRIDASPAAGILHTLVERRGSLLVLGWKGHRAGREALFGGIIDRILAESPVPMLIGRMDGDEPRRILLAISEANTTPEGLAGLDLGIETAARLLRPHIPVRVISNTDDPALDELIAQRLGVEVTHDARKRSIMVRSHVEPGDLVIIPVKPEMAGLRGAAARIARGLPDNDLIVALDTRSPVAMTPPEGSDDEGESLPAPVDVKGLLGRSTAAAKKSG